ncbi:hypothetical protein M3M50_10920 [Pseudomonas bijieensis]|uniref:hypothetical protein n=1 Tax=Pseudomonas bijieensis TaxID=2681983 RepID=UPI00200F2CB4|nr:hypothetical protein [Pseudomonas bijieensis]UQI33110.1 hypothetical protein M3M50_10920 [Pseudomonas bijieensis]
MKFLIVQRRVLGVAIPKNELRNVQPVIGDIIISECPDPDFGRSVFSAMVFNSGPGPDILPRLHDVKITGMAHNGMNLTGVEKIGDAFYSQSWWCRVE